MEESCGKLDYRDAGVDLPPKGGKARCTAMVRGIPKHRDVSGAKVVDSEVVLVMSAF